VEVAVVAALESELELEQLMVWYRQVLPKKDSLQLPQVLPSSLYADRLLYHRLLFLSQVLRYHRRQALQAQARSHSVVLTQVQVLVRDQEP